MTARVLIVDDEPNVVVSLEFLLRREGFEIAVAASGTDALAKVESFRPQLVLLDVMLPGIDGFEVCRSIRASGAEMKIILLTARGREAERLKGLDLGADLYVTKPFSTRDLISEVRRLLTPATHDGSSDG